MNPPFKPQDAAPNEHTVESARSSFEQRLAATEMPPPGPAYFDARRALWWTPGAKPPRQAKTSAARRRLERLLSQNGATESDQVWTSGLNEVWKALISGSPLKIPLPLDMVISCTGLVHDSHSNVSVQASEPLPVHDCCRAVKILMAGWIRDGTWPRGGVAPEPDDELTELPPPLLQSRPSSTTTPDRLEETLMPGPIEARIATIFNGPQMDDEALQADTSPPGNRGPKGG